MLVQIKFIVSGACSAVGGFAPGDIARIPADLAKHLVEEAKCAKYVEAPAKAEPAAVVEAAPEVEPQRKRRGK